MADTDRPSDLATTLGALRASGWVSRPVKQEVRALELAAAVGLAERIMAQSDEARIARLLRDFATHRRDEAKR